MSKKEPPKVRTVPAKQKMAGFNSPNEVKAQLQARLFYARKNRKSKIT